MALVRGRAHFHLHLRFSFGHGVHMLTEMLPYVLATVAGLVALHFGRWNLTDRTHKYLSFACWLNIALFSLALLINSVVELIKLGRR